jgi:hypothetical protein
MNDALAERNYAWRMIRTARLSQTTAVHADDADIVTVLSEALDAGLGQAEIIIELADLGARMFALCNPADLADGEAETCPA